MSNSQELLPCRELRKEYDRVISEACALFDSLLAFVAGALTVGFFWLGWYSYTHQWHDKHTAAIAEVYGLTLADAKKPINLWEEK